MNEVIVNSWDDYCPDDLIDALASFHKLFGEIDVQWNMSIEHLKTVMRFMYSSGLSMWEGFSGKHTLLGYPIVIGDYNRITISERQFIPEPLATTDDVISLTCVNCAAPLKTMTCEYCGTAHKVKV